MISTTRRRMFAAVAGLLATAGVVAALAIPANATSQTCITAPSGYVCAIAYGNGTDVSALGVSRGKSTVSICNASAWFFYIPPTGGAFSLGSQQRAGCVFGRAWFQQPVNRSFPHNTLVCAKFYEDAWTSYIGQQCVGLS